MNINKQIQMTKKGFDALNEELRVLMEEKRPKIVDRLSKARAEGDLAENSDYQNAKDDLEFLDGKISELQDVIKHVSIVSTKNTSNAVAVGASVIVKINGQKQEYHVVGDWEADPKEKKISHTSPLGKALMGKKKGESVEVEAPAGKITYEIVKIS